MANVKLPKRSSVSIFIEEDVNFFYENILLVCESDRNSFGQEKILKEAAKNIVAFVPFDFVHNDYEKEMKTPKDNVFYFSAATKMQNPKRKHSQIVRQWYKHLRNAFAHNYIRQENGAYIFEDYYQEEKEVNNQKVKTTEKVLYARILSLDEFKNLITEVKSKLK